jgi:hypothetical protein
MTITSPTRQRGPLAKLALVSTVSLGLVAGPVAFAGPASAMGGDNGRNDKVNCWVEAKKPYLVSINHHHKFAKVDFAFKIKCDKDAKVTWHQWTLKEKKNGHRAELIKYHKGDVDVRKNRAEYDSNRDRVDKERGENHVKVFHIVKIDFKKKDNDKGRGHEGHDSDKSKTLTIRFSGGGY